MSEPRRIIRWPGRRTSGRYVYKSTKGEWYWQCDLHDISVGSFHTWPTQREAFENAMIHAKKCPETNRTPAPATAHERTDQK